MKQVVLDFETASATDLKVAGAWRYAECPTTDVLCLVFGPIGLNDPHVWTPESGGVKLEELARDPKAIFIRHGEFELAIWRRIMVPVYGFSDIPNERWHDTMAAAAVKACPLSVEFCAQVLNVPAQKDTEGRKITLGLSKFDKKGRSPARTPEVLQRVIEYCKGDWWAEKDIHLALGFLPEHEVDAFLLNQRMNEHGLRLDREYIAACQEIVDKASEPLEKRFVELTGFRTTQVQKVRAWVEGRGVPIPNLAKETVEELLGTAEDHDAADDIEAEGEAALPEDVVEALSIRALIGSSSIKKLRTMLECVCADGYVRGVSQFHGTSPGRNTGRLFQPYNFPRGVLKHDKDTSSPCDHATGDPKCKCKAPSPEITVATIKTRDPAHVAKVLGPPVHAVLSGLRHTIIAADGHTFMSGDYSGIQARVVLALAGQHDKTAIMAQEGADIYCDMATQIFKRPINKKDHPEERQTGKNSVLGLGFQMGAKKFWDKYCKKQPFEFAENVVRVYRKEWAPKVPALWYGLQDASIDALRTGKPKEAFGIEYRVIDKWLTARLPSGRLIWYTNPTLVKRAMPWDHTDIRLAWTYDAVKNGRVKRITAFGGQLTENVVMGIECDIHRKGMMNCEARGMRVAHECYDEIMVEVPLDKLNPALLRECMLDQDDWVHDMKIPIQIDDWHGPRYRK